MGPKLQARDPNRVSVIMTCYNSAKFIHGSIESVLNQTHKNLELLIIDDKSTDNSLEIIKNLANKDKRIRVFRNLENMGTYWSKNSVIHKSTGSFITMLDSDDYDLPHRIETQVNAIKNMEGAVMATCLNDRKISETSNVSEKVSLGYPSMMFRYEVYEKLGYYDTTRFGADAEFYDRVIKVYGHDKIARVNEVLQIQPRRQDGLTGIFPERSALRSEYTRLYERWQKYTKDYYVSFPTTDRPFVINEKAMVKYADLSNSVVEHTKSTKTLPVIMCVWKRVDGFIKTIEQLNKQTLRDFKLFIWNNNPDLEEEFLEALKLAKFKYEMHTSHDNIGGFGRFYYAKHIRRSEGLLDYCVFVDDDQTFEKDTLSILLSEAKPNNITSQWGWEFTGYDYYGESARIERKPGESLHYTGTGGMVVDMRLFDSDGLYKCPKEYWFVEDLWMSFYANHYLNYSLTKSACKVINGDDEHSLYKVVFDIKKKMLKDLIDNYKWNIHGNFDEIEIKPIEIITPKISVVMPSYLGDYNGSRSNPIFKFNRAVKSFLSQGYSNKELVIVSDGCELTNNEYEKNWKSFDNIKLVKISKNSSKWPGTNRQVGIDNATGDWITYLDADDILHHSHLTNIAHHIHLDNKVIFNIASAKALQFNIHGNIRGWLFLNGKKMHANKLQEYISKEKQGAKTLELDEELYFYIPDILANNSLKFNTARIAHKRSCDVKWTDRSARGEDIIFSEALIAKYKYKLINSPTYIVCHVPGRLDI